MTLTLFAQSQNNDILFEEHFDNNAKGWSVGDNEWAIVKIENGKLYFECKAYLKPTGGTAWIVAPWLTLPADNFKIQCLTEWLSNKNTNGLFHAYGFQVGNYRFELFANGHRRLMFWDGKQDNTIVDFDNGNPSIFTRGKGVIYVTIEIENGIAKLFANDQLLFEKEIGSASGQLQLRTSHSEVVEFDDLVVTRLPVTASSESTSVLPGTVAVSGGSLQQMVWMTNNLDVEHFRNGDAIPEAKTENDWKKAAVSGSPVWCYYNNNQDGIESPGKLYNWWAVNDKRGLAPRGWHITNANEWAGLVDDEIGEMNFYSESNGYRTAEGRFLFSSERIAHYWTTDPGESVNVDPVYNDLSAQTSDKGSGYFVRCVKGEK